MTPYVAAIMNWKRVEITPKADKALPLDVQQVTCLRRATGINIDFTVVPRRIKLTDLVRNLTMPVPRVNVLLRF